MSNIYGVAFGSGDCRNFSGLSPTFVIFNPIPAGASLIPPSITEVGMSLGLYYFTFAPSATYTVFFQIDAGSSVPEAGDRFVRGNLDPIAAVDKQLGFMEDSYGGTALPTTVFGNVKRVVQLWQSDATFSKTSGVWLVYAQGTSTILYEKTLSNSTGAVTKV